MQRFRVGLDCLEREIDDFIKFAAGHGPESAELGRARELRAPVALLLSRLGGWPHGTAGRLKVVAWHVSPLRQALYVLLEACPSEPQLVVAVGSLLLEMHDWPKALINEFEPSGFHPPPGRKRSPDLLEHLIRLLRANGFSLEEIHLVLSFGSAPAGSEQRRQQDRDAERARRRRGEEPRRLPGRPPKSR